MISLLSWGNAKKLAKYGIVGMGLETSHKPDLSQLLTEIEKREIFWDMFVDWYADEDDPTDEIWYVFRFDYKGHRYSYSATTKEDAVAEALIDILKMENG